MGLNRLLQRKSGDATDKSSKQCGETAPADCHSGHGVPRELLPSTEEQEQVKNHPPCSPGLWKPRALEQWAGEMHR